MTSGDRETIFTTRRRFLGGIVGTAAAAALTAPWCAAAEETGLAHDIAARARALAVGRAAPLRLLMPEGCGDNLAPVVALFRELAGVAVELVQVPVDDIGARLTIDALGGTADYDLALPATFNVPDLVAAGAIVPLGEYANRHEPEGLRDDVLYRVGDSFDGKMYGFQTDGDAYMMFYNRDLLESEEERARYAERFGEPLDIPRTWAELDRQMAWFHRPEEGLHGGLLFRSAGYLAWEWWVRFHAKGVWPLSPSLEPQIDSDAGVEALEEMVRAGEHLVPSTRSNGLFDNWERYARGDVYCNIGWGGTQKYLNGPDSAMRGRVAHGPTPGGMVNGELLTTPYFNWGWNYVVTASCDAPELAYLFALFAATPEMSTLSVRQPEGFFDPFRAEHYADPEIRSIYGESFLAVHESSLRAAVPDLYLSNHGEYFRLLGQWLDRSIAGLVEPSDALSRVARAWEGLTPRGELARQRKRWGELRAKYPEKIARHLRDLAG